MANEQTSALQAFTPHVSRLTEAISQQLAEAFADQHARAERERNDAVAAALAAEGAARARELDAQRSALDAQIRALRDDYDARLDVQSARARDEREALEARLRVELVTALDAAREDADLRKADAEEAADARIAEREQALAGGARLLTAFERLDAAHTLRETLDALVEGLAAEVARVLVFVVRGDGLRGWRFVGADGAPLEAGSVLVGRGEAGPLASALVSGAAVEVHPAALAASVAALDWVGSSADAGVTAGMAVPLMVDQQAVALVYCDDGLGAERSVPAAWPEVVQVLVRHASRCLEAHTARRAAGFVRPVTVPVGGSVGVDPSGPAVPFEAAASDIEAARRFARLVVSELKLYNESAVAAGREARDLRVRLRDELARARRLYDARVPATLPARDDYFDQEVVRTLADGDSSLLGDPATSAA